MENACHNRGDFTATVVKVTGTEVHVGRVWSVCVCVWGGCNRQWPPVYTCNFLEFLCIAPPMYVVHVAKAGLESLRTFAFY